MFDTGVALILSFSQRLVFGFAADINTTTKSIGT